MADKKISELDELTTPSSTDVLPISHGEDTYKVKVQNLVPPASSSLEDLEDVEITTPSDGDALVYDEENEKWVNGQGGGKQTALTQAEYDALVQAGTVDPKTAYFIKDTNGDGSQFQPVIYSLEEREIGVWTDGKPLYEKTVEFTSIRGGNDVALAHNISNIDNICYYLGYALLSNGSAYVNYADNGYYIELHEVGRTNTMWKIGNSIASQASKLIAVLRYTKTTDTTGSGTWTPQGIPAVHYSTDEQVVGTWIDGSTIFECVFDFQTPVVINGGEWADTPVSNSGINRIIECWGINETGTNWGYLGCTCDTNPYIKLLNVRNAEIHIKTMILRYTKSST